VTPDRRRRTIYVQPLGQFTDTERRIVHLTAELLGVYFELPVKTQKALPLSVIPARARRTHPHWGHRQILSTYVLERVLRPRFPHDACVYLGLTTSDLWPGEGWSFVFGQASLRDRVGVWSIYRNGDPTAGAESFRLCLRRTLKTAAHETCHMFSMQHCILYECNMCGSNHLAEADRQPLALCPHCLAKLCHATGANPERRYVNLITFCRTNGLAAEQDFYQRLLIALRDQQ
jgi:archaemetzincin